MDPTLPLTLTVFSVPTTSRVTDPPAKNLVSLRAIEYEWQDTVRIILEALLINYY